MDNNINEQALLALSEALEVSDTAYEIAEGRYGDLGGWLHDETKAECARYSPEVFPQGSFRLGTVVKPWKREDFDLDLVCTLRRGISTKSCSQAELKELLGNDLVKYRAERGIKEEIEEKHRCWRINYTDGLKFHVDSVPSLPHDQVTQSLIQERMVKFGSSKELSSELARLTLAITDNRHPKYREISSDWNISNPEGYARWFESRMRQAQQLLESRALSAKVASIEELPVYRWKTPLQSAVQILKRHRDVMFENNTDSKPISIIITTLSARAYTGTLDLLTTLSEIITSMSTFVSKSTPRVPNPVNPEEDFADRWATPEGRRLGLEENFERWHTQLAVDFQLLSTTKDKGVFGEQALKKFGTSLEGSTLTKIFGVSSSTIVAPRVHHITEPQKPWQGQ